MVQFRIMMAMAHRLYNSSLLRACKIFIATSAAAALLLASGAAITGGAAGALPPHPPARSDVYQHPGGTGVRIELNSSTGAFAVAAHGWRLPGGPLRIHCNRKWYCALPRQQLRQHPECTGGRLSVIVVNPATTGVDALGEFLARSLVWASADGAVASLITQYRQYESLGAAVFQLRMKSNCANCSLDPQQQITQFPSLDVDRVGPALWAPSCQSSPLLWTDSGC